MQLLYIVRAMLLALRQLRVFKVLRRHFPNQYQPVILITGCGSGIGLAIARLLQDQYSYRLVLTARSRSLDFLRKEFPQSDRLMVRELDVNSGEQRQRLLAEVELSWGGVDILVNNAGISFRAVVEHMTEKDELLQMQTNYLGPMALIRGVLPRMRERGRGKIINVSSVSGMLAMPTMSSYSASKYALEGASEALWYETKPLGINVSLIQPGFVHSASFMNVYHTEKSRPQATSSGPYEDYYYYMIPFVERMMNASRSTPMDIARTVLKVIQTENPPLWVPATADAKLFYYIRRLMPRRWLLPVLFYCLPKAHLWAKGYSHRRT